MRRSRFPLYLGLAIGLPFNLAWGAAALAETLKPGEAAAYSFPIFALLPVGGSVLQQLPADQGRHRPERPICQVQHTGGAVQDEHPDT